MNMDVTTTDGMEIMDPMNEDELVRLDMLEGIIKSNFGAFVDTGLALAEIRDKKLYRQGHLTFEAYCKENLEVGRSKAYQLIDSANVIQNLSTIGGQIGEILPMNERQARPLTKLPPEDQVKAWKEVLETCRKPTAHAVERVAKQYHNEEIKSQYRETKKRVSTESTVSTEFRKGFQAFMDVVAEERNHGWKKTSKKAAIKHISTIIKLIEQDD